MIRNYWKQVLVAAYVIVVLFLSATARATSELPDSNLVIELNELQKRIESLYGQQASQAIYISQEQNFRPEPAVAYNVEASGYFLVDQISEKLVFVSDEESTIYQISCDDQLKSKITSDKIYTINGIKFSGSINNLNSVRPPKLDDKLDKNLNNYIYNPKEFIFVTGVETQR